MKAAQQHDVYVYFNNDLHAYAVRNAISLRRMVLGSDPGHELPPPIA